MKASSCDLEDRWSGIAYRFERLQRPIPRRYRVVQWLTRRLFEHWGRS